MSEPISAKGRNGTITFDGHVVVISRTGFLARATIGKGEKRIPVGQITAIQLKPAGAVMDGFLQFTIGGGNEVRSRFGQQSRDARTDENTVMFWRKEQPAFEALRDAIEAAQRQATAPAAPVADLPGQLAQLAELRRTGVLDDAQFEAAKARLLGG